MLLAVIGKVSFVLSRRQLQYTQIHPHNFASFQWLMLRHASACGAFHQRENRKISTTTARPTMRENKEVIKVE